MDLRAGINMHELHLSQIPQETPKSKRFQNYPKCCNSKWHTPFRVLSYTLTAFGLPCFGLGVAVDYCALQVYLRLRRGLHLFEVVASWLC